MMALALCWLHLKDCQWTDELDQGTSGETGLAGELGNVDVSEGSDTREISYNVTEIQPEIQKSREIHGKS